MFQKKTHYRRFFVIAFACTTLLFAINLGAQQQNAVKKQTENLAVTDVKTMLFKDANTAMESAINVQADILAPDNFGQAMKRYQKAETDLQKGKSLDDIRENLVESTAFFQKAMDATKLADVTFPNAMKARMDAQTTNAAKFSSELWIEAEKKFDDAARELEGGDLNDAKKKATDAEKLYRQAELEAIKANYLDETRDLLEQAKQLNVKKYAPKTLQRSQQLVMQAEKELNENRYDTDVARSLAQQANYEAKHSIYLAKTIRQMEKNKNSLEDVMLLAETPLQQIAEKMDMSAEFDRGFDKPTDAIINNVVAYQDSVANQSQDLNQYQRESDVQKARIAEMEQQLGSQAVEKSALAQQIESQAKTRAILVNMQKSFTREEARVLQEDNDIIIRLVGLSFPSGTATIEQKYFGLLSKVRDSINSFPISNISILGNTDSHGGDAQNLKLSKERAEAVRQYLLANTDRNSSQIESIGYGESKPISSNETAAGRATNRRVDVVIHTENVKMSLLTE